jgi:hypothetical protein
MSNAMYQQAAAPSYADAIKQQKVRNFCNPLHQIRNRSRFCFSCHNIFFLYFSYFFNWHIVCFNDVHLRSTPNQERRWWDRFSSMQREGGADTAFSVHPQHR